MAEKILLDQVRDAIRVKHRVSKMPCKGIPLRDYSYRTEQTYVDWNRRSILFFPETRLPPRLKPQISHYRAG
ncbi:MAG: hypothetical protein U1B80_01860 [Anaerolineaceae bacterium]|nr:hypothetical protein [Anaerolineaceae bacterium]